MALTVMRVIQFKLKKALSKNSEKAPYCSYGIPGARIAKLFLIGSWSSLITNSSVWSM